MKVLISFFVVLGLFGSAAAVDRTWTGAVDANWFNADNWSPAGVPEGGYDPCSGDIVHINGGVSNFPVINTTDPCAWCRKLWLGSEPNSDDAYLTIEAGGELTVRSYDPNVGNQTIVLGQKTGTHGIIEMTGGTINMTAGEQFEIGGRSCDGKGTFDMTGGKVNNGDLRLPGFGGGGISVINLDGGVIDCNEFEWSSDTKSGTLNLYSGTLICDYLAFLSGGYCNLYGGVIDSNKFKMWQGFGLMDIYEGIWHTRLQIPEIWIDPFWPSYYVSLGQIVAYGGRGEVVIDWPGKNDPCDPVPEKDANELWVYTDFDANAAYGPQPEDGATGASPEQTLSWYPAYNGNAAFHDVYFGEEFNDVNNATVSYPCGVYVGRQEANSIARPDYWPMPLVMGNTYYWRIDEVNEADPCSLWKGPVWSFSFSYVDIDDFESYNDSNELDDVWKDYDTQAEPKTWCYAFLNTDQALDSRSMFLSCFNSFPPYYGEVRRTFAQPQDWSPVGTDVRLLAFSVYGKADNPPHNIYVRLEDSLGNDAVQRLSDANAVQVEKWTALLFALSEFTSPDVIDLSKISKITIGVDPEPPGSGWVDIWVDNVRLYLPGCYPNYLRAAGDINADCITDFDDLEQMALQWLSDEPDVEVDLYLNGCIDFKDFVILDETWLQELLFGE